MREWRVRTLYCLEDYSEEEQMTMAKLAVFLDCDELFVTLPPEAEGEWE